MSPRRSDDEGPRGPTDARRDGAAGGTGGGPAGEGSAGEERSSGREPAPQTGDELLAEAVDRMAHQIKNPLQAVAMNLEVIRMRVRKEAPELWSGLERYGEAVDQNVSVLDRRLRLLLRLGRRSTDEAPESVDVAALVRDFSEALQLHEEQPRMVVRVRDERPSARARPGYVLALVLDVWRVGRRAAEEPELTVSVSAEGGEVVLEVAPRPGGGEGGDVPAPWRAAASRAGGRLEVDGTGRPGVLRLVLPRGGSG